VHSDKAEDARVLLHGVSHIVYNQFLGHTRYKVTIPIISWDLKTQMDSAENGH